LGPEPGHKLAWIFKAGDVANLCDHGRCDDRVHAAQCAKAIDDRDEAPRLNRFIDRLIQRRNAGLRLVDSPLQLLEGQLLMREAEAAEFGEPTAVALRPVTAILVSQPMPKQEAELSRSP